MSGPTKKELQAKIDRLDQLNISRLGELSLLERKCDELSRELERVRSKNKALAEAKYETEKRYATLLENSQRALVLNTEILSKPLPSNAPSQDIGGCSVG